MAAALRFVEISKEFLDSLLDNSIPDPRKDQKGNKVRDEDLQW